MEHKKTKASVQFLILIDENHLGHGYFATER